jgi:hypothetical protein
MAEDPRCCGSGTCIIDTEGRCWCGQQWDGDQLHGPASACAAPAPLNPSDTPPEALSGAAHSTHA